MTKTMSIHSRYFFGNEISECGLKNGRVDYCTLAKAFNAVANDDILNETAEIGYWELYNGSDYDEEEDEFAEIFQCFIVDEKGAEILSKWTNEIVYYNEALNMYVWGVTHFGTSWDYVLTDIEIA